MNHNNHNSQHQDSTKTIYVCPMHPEIQQNNPGRCPECGMNLVPAKQKRDVNHGQGKHAGHVF